MNHRETVVGHWFCGMLLLGVILAPVARAVDCGALLTAAGQEPGLLEQSQLLGEAVKACPKHAEITYKYGYSLERLRKYDEALEYYKRAARINAKTAKYYFGMADIYVIKKDVPAAIAAYEEGLRLEPKNSRARVSLEELAPAKAQVVEAPPVKQTEPLPAVKEVAEEKVKVEVAVKTPSRSKEEVKISGPTLKLKTPGSTELAGLAAVLEKERAQQGKDDLAAAPGGAAFKAGLAGKQEALRASAQADAVSIDSERLKVVGTSAK